MKLQFTQGSILEGVRSNKYKGVKCKGIVITARCDISNDKVENYHYLTAISLIDWIYEILYFEIVQELINEIYNAIREYAKDRNLDFETLISLEPERAKIVLEANAKKQKEITRINDWILKWIQYNECQCSDTPKDIRNDILKSYGSKKLKSKIRPLYNSNYKKYCFIPAKAYDCNTSLVDGLVVDLHDIHQVNKNVMNDILDYKYDFKLVVETYKREKINDYFFFEAENDFVIINNYIQSPWIEYLLQLFANSYIRIGVDNANEEEITTFCDDFMERI